MNEKQREAALRLADDRTAGSLEWSRQVVALLRELAQEPAQEPVAYADKIAFESAMTAGKGCDVWPEAGDYKERTGRELVSLYAGPPQHRPLTAEQKVKLLRASRDAEEGLSELVVRVERAHGITE